MDINTTEYAVKRNHKIVDAINYNGRYIDSDIIKKKVISTAAVIAGCVIAGIVIVLL